MDKIEFEPTFHSLTGYHSFPWQCALYELFAKGEFPKSCNLPTGLGKTNVIAVWLIALLNEPTKVPRRLVYVVNRRTVVDQTTNEIVQIRNRLIGEFGPRPKLLWQLCILLEKLSSTPENGPLAISTLRGQFADNREWSADPSRPAVICGTVDMIGSRLLFSGYGVGFKGKPLHAGFLGQDVLLVHDEAHLEPAFQILIERIEKEQHDSELTDLTWPKLRVIELTATPRSEGKVFELTDSEKQPPQVLPDPTEPIHHVWQRLCAKKGVNLEVAERKTIAKSIGEKARDRWKTSGKAILVFVRTVDDVKTVHTLLTDKKNGVPEDQVLLLTGTLRGLERDEMVEKDVFHRFQLKKESDGRTVYLVCTSAGEVGVDISADHMICDLTTLDSIAQRLGRVNRRGGGQAEIDLYYESDPDPKKIAKDFEKARWKTLEILRRLPKCDWDESRYDASPLALGKLNLIKTEREAAFAPLPTILPVTDILFDAWALTTIRGELPGRPPVEPYLHGIAENDPPQTTIAWREEVEKLGSEILKQNHLTIEDLLEMFPLKPHEELSVTTYNNVYEQLEAIAERDEKCESGKRLSAWVIDSYGCAKIYSLQDLVKRDNQKKPIVRLGGRTVILPPHAGGLSGGLLKGDEPHSESICYDVSCKWWADAEKTIPRRIRVWQDDSNFDKKRKGMRLIGPLPIIMPVSESDEDAESRKWHWYEMPKAGDSDGSTSNKKPVLWQVHTDDVVKKMTQIVAKFSLPDEMKQAFILAAEFHDLGKRRSLFQKILGNFDSTRLLAKSGKQSGRVPEQYRHEFGSLIDLEQEEEFKNLPSEDLKEHIRHLIAVHHGYGRPHFPNDLAFDPERPQSIADQIAIEVPQRFARLQRKYGRWGLAYLESLLRAADWAASANPSTYVEDEK